MWDLVGNPEDRFSQNEAHISSWATFALTDLSTQKEMVLLSFSVVLFLTHIQ